MKLTVFLILLCVAGFIYPMFFIQDIDSFYDTYAFSGQNLPERPYVLVTSIFMHGNLMHLISNILVLFFFGMAVEKEIGPWKMMAIFFAGGFLGDLLSLLVYPFDALSVGASAGIFALVGAGILVKPLDFSFYPFIMPMPLALIGIMYAIYNIYGFITDPLGEISYIAHFGGLIVGLTYGFRREGFKKGMKIILLMLLLMIAIPVIFMMLFMQ